MSFNKLSPQEQQADLIHRYLSDELSDTEKQQVEIRIRRDPNFSKEVNIYRSLLSNMKVIRRERMAENLNQWYREHTFSKVEKKPLWPVNGYYYIAAAAIILVLFFGYWIWAENTTTTSLSTEALYTETFSVYPAEVKRRIVKDSLPLTDLEIGLNYYNKSEFKPAIETLLKAMEDPKTSTYNRLFLGIAYLEVDEPKNAIRQFETLIEPLNEIYGETARWYLAMAYLKKGDKNNAELILDEIIRYDRHYHKEEAETLLKKF